MIINNKIIENEVLLGDAILPKGIPGIDNPGADTKLRWLRSQIIGHVADVHTPFGIRKLTYADHTASGRCLQYIEDYIIQTVLPFYGNTHTSDSYVGYRTMKVVHEATEYVKKCLGGTQDDALIFCGSGTTSAIKRLQEVVGIAIPSILKERVLNSSCLGSEERWVVFVGPYEHHSNLLSWRQSLAEVIEIGLDEDGMTDMDNLKCQLQFYQGTGRPMLGSFSACSNVTGISSDTRSLSSLLHEFGAFACFDFAASGPYVEIDMRSGANDGYDAIVLSPHKFLGGPGSPGILLMSKTLYQLNNSPPSTCGGGTVNYVNYFDEQDTLYINDIEEREDAGTPQIIQRVKVALAFQVKEYIGGRIIAEKEHEYVRRALERLTQNKNIWVLGNTNAERQAIISFLIHSTSISSQVVDNEGIHKSSSETCRYKRDKPLDGAFVAKLLNDLFGIQARGGCACAGPYGHHLLGIDKHLSLAIKSAIEMGYNGVKSGWTRVSFPYYMSNDEHEFILSAIEFIALYGQRFLPLYGFNWNTGIWNFKADTLQVALLKENDCKQSPFTISNTSKVLQVVEDDIKKKTFWPCIFRRGHMASPKACFLVASKTEKTKKYCKTTEEDSHFTKFALYLEIAKHIGNKLPKFPSGHTIPKGVNPEAVWFRV